MRLFSSVGVNFDDIYFLSFTRATRAKAKLQAILAGATSRPSEASEESEEPMDTRTACRDTCTTCRAHRDTCMDRLELCRA